MRRSGAVATPVGSFASFKDFVRRGGHGAIVPCLRSAEPPLEVKRASLDDATSVLGQRLRGLDTLFEPDADAARQMAEAFVDSFDARHTNPRLPDLEYRLGSVPEADLPNAHHDAAYLDASALVGAAAFTSAATSLGPNQTRLRPQTALVAPRSATARHDELAAWRRATVSSLVARRFAERSAQEHGPQRHEGPVRRQMLIEVRVCLIWPGSLATPRRRAGNGA